MSIANIMRNNNPLFNIFDSFVFSMGFKSLESFLKLNLKDVRMANNFTALFHASGASLLTGVYFLLGKIVICYIGYKNLRQDIFYMI